MFELLHTNLLDKQNYLMKLDEKENEKFQSHSKNNKNLLKFWL